MNKNVFRTCPNQRRRFYSGGAPLPQFPLHGEAGFVGAQNGQLQTLTPTLPPQQINPWPMPEVPVINPPVGAQPLPEFVPQPVAPLPLPVAPCSCQTNQVWHAPEFGAPHPVQPAPLPEVVPQPVHPWPMPEFAPCPHASVQESVLKQPIQPLPLPKPKPCYKPAPKCFTGPNCPCSQAVNNIGLQHGVTKDEYDETIVVVEKAVHLAPNITNYYRKVEHVIPVYQDNIHRFHTTHEYHAHPEVTLRRESTSNTEIGHPLPTQFVEVPAENCETDADYADVPFVKMNNCGPNLNDSIYQMNLSPQQPLPVSEEEHYVPQSFAPAPPLCKCPRAQRAFKNSR